MSKYNLEIEKHILALLVQNPEVWAEITIVNDRDFSKAHRPIFSVIKQQIESNLKNPSVTSIILAEKLKIYNIKLDGGIDAYDYFEALQLKSVNPSDIVNLAKELKRTTVRRELIDKSEGLAKELTTNGAMSFQEMTELVERNLSSVNTSYFKSDETIGVFDDIIEVTEERGENPLDSDEMGFLGPFPSINRTLGALHYQGAFTVVGSRTGGGKSSLGFYYNLCVAEKYDLPILHLDAAEMTVQQLQGRAICALSQGVVPLWAVRSGEWRKNKEWTRIIREDIWPRVKKIRIDYCNIGGMTPKEAVSFVKRYYYNKIGRERHLIIDWDYIKGTESTNRNNQEYQSIGYMVGDFKTLVTDEIDASIWTSVQNNKTGIYTGKSGAEIVDSEGSMSLSDRILQQATTGFTMRFKVPDELADEQNLFGNVKLAWVKTRELLGKNFERALLPVRMPSGALLKNYCNLNTKAFFYEDKGDLHDQLEILGQKDVLDGKGDNTKRPI